MDDPHDGWHCESHEARGRRVLVGRAGGGRRRKSWKPMSVARGSEGGDRCFVCQKVLNRSGQMQMLGSVVRETKGRYIAGRARYA